MEKLTRPKPMTTTTTTTTIDEHGDMMETQSTNIMDEKGKSFEPSSPIANSKPANGFVSPVLTTEQLYAKAGWVEKTPYLNEMDILTPRKAIPSESFTKSSLSSLFADSDEEDSDDSGDDSRAKKQHEQYGLR